MTIKELPEETRLRQLAEECSECTKAALKLIRAMNKETPISEDEAKRNLVEEIADVSVCITALSDIALQKEICEIIARKASRWEERINDKTGSAV
jgi:NTP pyrophosphatase (non-canonical NTP hydrolase)